MTGRSSAPPSHPRRRRWTPPDMGAYLIRTSDTEVFQVRQIDRASAMVQLVACVGGRQQWIHAGDLDRDYREAGDR